MAARAVAAPRRRRVVGSHGADPRALPARAGTLPLGVIRVADPRPQVALTFDDGPDPRFTPAILAILHRARVPATFFVLGRFARDHPRLVREERSMGFEVECHGWVHRSMAAAPPGQVLAAVGACRREIHALTGRMPGLARPAYGLLTAAATERLEKAGVRVVYWNVDFAGREPNPERAASSTARRVLPGSIVLLHDGRSDRSCVVAASHP
ncbi:MAG: polysaccharide deacetylase family protein [Actinomycetota bacterium]